MVKFEGQLSDECVLYRTKFSDRVVIIGTLVCLAVASLIILMVALFGEVDVDMIKETLTWMGLLVVVIIIMTISFFRRKKPHTDVDIELIIDSDFIEYTVLPFKTEKIPMSRIKKVIKIGRRYYIIRRLGDISSSIMAEEALLKEGTIEEFEALFADKLVIRTK